MTRWAASGTVMGAGLGVRVRPAPRLGVALAGRTPVRWYSSALARKSASAGRARDLNGSRAAAMRSRSSPTFLAAPAQASGPVKLLMKDWSSATCMVLDSPFEFAGQVAEQRPQLLGLRGEGLILRRLREQRILADV